MKVIVVMPAYNAAKTLEKTVMDIPPKIVDEIILVDDASHDKTVDIAKKLGLTVVTHPQNRGYGANQKTCYTLALSHGADIVVMLHPDYQYDARLIGKLIKPIYEKQYTIMLGSRIQSRKAALDGGMPLYKYIFNRFLTLIENIVLRQKLSEYHTGFRAFHKSILSKVPFHSYSDDFVFDQEILLGSITRKAKIGEIFIPVRYFKEASSINFSRSLTYGICILIDLFRYVVTFGKAF